jgi:hypothetical protein
MDVFITTVIRNSIASSGLSECLGVQQIGDRIWIRDDRIQRGHRWCIIEVNGSILKIQNGNHDTAIINLSHPNSLNELGTLIDEALMTSRLYASD